MDLLRYFKKKSLDGGLPNPTGSLSCHIPSAVIVHVNRLVQAARLSIPAVTRHVVHTIGISWLHDYLTYIFYCIGSPHSSLLVLEVMCIIMESQQLHVSSLPN